MSTGRVLWIISCCVWTALWLLAAAWELPRQACGMYQLVNPGCMYTVTTGSAWGAAGFGALAAVSLLCIWLPVGGVRAKAPGRGRGGQLGNYYSRPEIEQLWIDCGGAPGRAGIAASVAIAESGGYADAICAIDGRIGLWQVPGWVVNGLHPRANAVAAIEMSRNGTDWSWFPGYVNGAYRKFV